MSESKKTLADGWQQMVEHAAKLDQYEHLAEAMKLDNIVKKGNLIKSKY